MHNNFRISAGESPYLTMNTVVFDFDGTLTTSDTTKYLIVHLMRGSPMRCFGVLLRAIRYRHSVQEGKVTVIGTLIKNRKASSIYRNLKPFVRSVRRRMRQSAVDILNRHLGSGDYVIIATASPGFAVEPIFYDPRVHVVATGFSQRNGMFTGELETPVCYGNQKAEMVRQHLEAAGLRSLDAAYSDHLSDGPLLAMAKEAVLVAPDKATVQGLQ